MKNVLTNFLNRLFHRVELPANGVMEPAAMFTPATTVGLPVSDEMVKSTNQAVATLYESLADVSVEAVNTEKLLGEINNRAKYAAESAGVLIFASDLSVLDTWPSFNGSKAKISHSFAGRRITATVARDKDGCLGVLERSVPSIKDVKLSLPNDVFSESEDQVTCRVSWRFRHEPGMTVEMANSQGGADPLTFDETLVVCAHHVRKGVFEVRVPGSTTSFFLLRDLVERDVPELIDRVPSIVINSNAKAPN